MREVDAAVWVGIHEGGGEQVSESYGVGDSDILWWERVYWLVWWEKGVEDVCPVIWSGDGRPPLAAGQ